MSIGRPDVRRLRVMVCTIALMVCVPAKAAQFRIEAGTTGEAYQLLSSMNDILNRRYLHQSLAFGAYDLLGDGE